MDGIAVPIVTTHRRRNQRFAWVQGGSPGNVQSDPPTGGGLLMRRTSGKAPRCSGVWRGRRCSSTSAIVPRQRVSRTSTCAGSWKSGWPCPCARARTAVARMFGTAGQPARTFAQLSGSGKTNAREEFVRSRRGRRERAPGTRRRARDARGRPPPWVRYLSLPFTARLEGNVKFRVVAFFSRIVAREAQASFLKR